MSFRHWDTVSANGLDVFFGNARRRWESSKSYHDTQGSCTCEPEYGCGESCGNRITMIECDENNCNCEMRCNNRSIANLRSERISDMVDIRNTNNRGYGMFSKVSLKANTALVMYLGEIITEAEKDNRWPEYKSKGVGSSFFLKTEANRQIASLRYELYKEPLC
jgi:SET domain-containing protein